MTVIDANVLERRRRMRENGRLMDARWDKLQADLDEARTVRFLSLMGRNSDGTDIEREIDFDAIAVEGVPHPEEVVEQRAGLPKSAILTWTRSATSHGPDAFHVFKISYPVGLSDHAQARIVDGLKGLGWELKWNAWLYLGTATEEDAYRHLETLLKMEVAKIFHRGDTPLLLSGSVTLNWNPSRPDVSAIGCHVGGLDKLKFEKLQQFISTIESHDGFLNGQSLTFQQISSGDIVASLKMAGFQVSQSYPSEEPHFIEISESAPIWVSGALGHEDWIFVTKGDFWEVRIGGSDPELFPRWSYGGRHGDTTFSAASMQFWEAEQLIGLAIQQYIGGHPEKPLEGG